MNVGEAVGGGGVGVGGGWIGRALVGMGVGVGEGILVSVGEGDGIAVKVGKGVAGVGCAAIGVGGWTSTGRSPNASTKAAITVTTTTPTAARLTKTGRRRESPVSWPSGRSGSVEVLAMIPLNSTFARLVGAQIQWWYIHFHPRVVVALADRQQEAESRADAHLAFNPNAPTLRCDQRFDDCQPDASLSQAID